MYHGFNTTLSGHRNFSNPVTGIDPHTQHLTPQRSEETRAVIDGLHSVRKASSKNRPNAYSNSVDVSELAAVEKLIKKHLVDYASTSYECPRNGKIQTLLGRYMSQKEPVLCFQISARDLAKIHPGSVSFEKAEHLHPYQPGMSTQNPLEDEKLITVVWRYPKPKSGDLHPEPIELTDGTLMAAFLTKEAGDISQFKTYTERTFDMLHGNSHAMDPSLIKRALFGTLYRFKSYAQGIGEGLSIPRFNGAIGANLLLTSLPISAILYGLFYGIDYGITKHELAHTKAEHEKHHHHHAVTQSDGSSTYSLGD